MKRATAIGLVAAALMLFGQTTINGIRDLVRIAAPATPPAGSIRVFANNSTGKLACLDSAGADCMPSGGGSSSVFFVARHTTSLLSSGGTGRFYLPTAAEGTTILAEADAQIAMPRAGTLTNFWVRAQTGGDNNINCLIHVNGATSPLNITFTADGTIKTGSDADTVTVAQFDLVAMRCVNNATTGSAGPLQSILELQ